MQPKFTLRNFRLTYFRIISTALCIVFLSNVSQSQVLINEGFTTVAPLPAGWAAQNLSSPVGTTGWFQGNTTVFPAQSGATTSYIGANFNNTTGANTISNWLFAPNITLKNGDIFTFYTRTITAPAFPDRLQIRMSTNGASTTASDFSALLLDINPTYSTAGYPNVWTQYTINISGLGGPISGRLAFRYFVEDGGPLGNNSDYIGIDNVVYTTFASPCAGTPVPGNTVSTVTNVCPSINFNLSLPSLPFEGGYAFQWQSSTAGVGGPFNNIGGATSSTLTISQTVATWYRCNVTCTNSSQTTASTPVAVAMSPATSCYCAAGATSLAFEKISRVQFNTIDNPSTATAGYENFTAISTTVIKGQTLPITVTIATPFAEDRILVWIDYNQNGSFSDAGELAYSSTSGVSPNIGSITIPTTAATGSTRMRIRLHDSVFGPNSAPCGNSTYGQVEDYTVDIQPCIQGFFTVHPPNRSVQCSGTTTFPVTATGSALTYLWEYRVNSTSLPQLVTNGGVYSGATTNTLTLTNVPETLSGYQYRVLIAGACTAPEFSNWGTLTVTSLIATVSPASATICAGTVQQLALTNVLAPVQLINEGFNTVSPLPAGWAAQQRSSPLGPTGWFQGLTGAFNAQSGANNSYIAADWQNTDPAGVGTISNWLFTPNITMANGNTFTFWSRKIAPDTYPDRLQVRMSTNGASTNVGATATSVGDFTTLLLDINPTLVTGVYPTAWTQYTIVISGLLGPTSGRLAFRYFVTNAGGAAPNSDYIGIDNVVYTAGAQAMGTWTANPATPNTMFTDALGTVAYTGTPANSIYVKPTVNTVYTVVFNSATPCTSAPTNIPVNVVDPVTAVVNPANKSVCVNGTTSFTVGASGGPIAYQWQVSTNSGISYSNVSSGGTSAVLTLSNVTQAMHNYLYRVTLTAAPCSGTITTPSAILTVNPLPAITLSASPYTSLRPQLSTTISAASTPAGSTYSWTFNGAPITGATGSSVIANVDGIGTYTATVTDVNGCVNVSSPFAITGMYDGRLFIYPNPAPNGQFQVRLYSSINFDYRNISIYNSIGECIYRKKVATTGPWDRMNVDLGHIGAGVYIVVVSDAYHTKRAVGKLIVQR